ncbi:unnamed protein product [Amaranthus hypochondriacus]
MTHQISRNGDQVVPQTRQMTRLLVSVTVRGSVGPIQVIVSPEDTVHDLIKDVLKVYVKENRRPLLSEIHPSCFGLHYSPFNLPSLKLDEKVMNLGSRKFFLCPEQAAHAGTFLEQSKQNEKFSFPLAKFLDFLRFLYNFLMHRSTSHIKN